MGIFESTNLYQYLNLISSIIATYVIARFCLVFPATAIDVETGLMWSWNTTHRNGWRTAIVIGLYPHLIAITIGLLVREGSTLLEQIVIVILCYIGLAIEIFALSLTFKELAIIYRER